MSAFPPVDFPWRSFCAFRGVRYGNDGAARLRVRIVYGQVSMPGYPFPGRVSTVHLGECDRGGPVKTVTFQASYSKRLPPELDRTSPGGKRSWSISPEDRSRRRERIEYAVDRITIVVVCSRV